MVWRGGLNASWCGPMRVVTHENQQVVWVTQHGRLYRHAPEHIRPVTAIESRMIKPEDVQDPIPEAPAASNSENPIGSDIPGIPPTIQTGQTSPNVETSSPSAEPDEPAGEPTPPASETADHQPGISDVSEHPDGCDVPVPDDDCHDELVGWRWDGVLKSS